MKRVKRPPHRGKRFQGNRSASTRGVGGRGEQIRRPQRRKRFQGNRSASSRGVGGRGEQISLHTEERGSRETDQPLAGG